MSNPGGCKNGHSWHFQDGPRCVICENDRLRERLARAEKVVEAAVRTWEARGEPCHLTNHGMLCDICHLGNVLRKYKAGRDE